MLQIIQAFHQKSNPKHKQEFSAKNCKPPTLTLEVFSRFLLAAADLQRFFWTFWDVLGCFEIF
jgi:hypothetical protein